nr:MAG TPA: hypothetical protein [Caudoviricetes sp.]
MTFIVISSWGVPPPDDLIIRQYWRIVKKKIHNF